MMSPFLSLFPEASYQLFSDNKEQFPNVQPRHGTLKDVPQSFLQEQNKKGAGIFFSPNGMSAGHRDEAHITRINAWYCDIDNKDGKNGKDVQYTTIQNSPLPPTAIVESRNGHHVYWVVKLGTTATKENFRQITKALAHHFHGDTACAEPARVLRIPGFYHLKDPKNPFKIKLIDFFPEFTYTEEEMLTAFPTTPIPTPASTTTPANAPTQTPASPFWAFLAQQNNKQALVKLSGTKFVKGDVFTFAERKSQGKQAGEYILVNNKTADAWLDPNGMIGSGAGKNGGPTWIQWLKYYGHDHAQIANIGKFLFPGYPRDETTIAVNPPDNNTSSGLEKPKSNKPPRNQDIANFILMYYENKLTFNQPTNSLYLYDSGKGVHDYIEEEDMIRTIEDLLENVLRVPQSITGNLRQEIYTLLTINAPRMELTRDPYIATKDGLYNIETDEIIPPMQSIFCPIYLPYTIEEIKTQPTPIWDKYIKETLVKEDGETFDPILHDFFMEVFGYLIAPQHRPHALPFLIGASGRNGKGVFTNGVLRKIYGDRIVSSVKLGKLTDSNKHASYQLVGKRLNICDEDESQYIENGMLKQISGEDPITIEPKYKKSFDYVCQAKFIISSNHMPKLTRLDNAMKSRILIIPFNHHTPEGERDYDLSDKLKTELPGIVYKAIYGWQRLKANNYVWTKSEQSLEALSVLERSVSAVHDWFYNCYKIPTEETEHIAVFFTSTQLFQDFNDWCKNNNRKPTSSNRFYKDLASLTGGSNLRRTNEKVSRGYSLISVQE